MEYVEMKTDNAKSGIILHRHVVFLDDSCIIIRFYWALTTLELRFMGTSIGSPAPAALPEVSKKLS